MRLVLALPFEHGLDLAFQEVIVLLQVVVLGKDGRFHLAEVVLVGGDGRKCGAMVPTGVRVAA